MTSKNSIKLVQKPCRIKHTRSISSPAAPDKVFPLLCPVREIDWAPGWQPDWVISDSGVAEKGCVFQTPGDDSHKSDTATWVVTRHEPVELKVEMLKIIPGHTVSCLKVALEPGNNGGTLATISYEYTALGPEGRKFVDECDDEWYEKMMDHWQTAMNHYLATGSLISMVA